MSQRSLFSLQRPCEDFNQWVGIPPIVSMNHFHFHRLPTPYRHLLFMVFSIHSFKAEVFFLSLNKVLDPGRADLPHRDQRGKTHGKTDSRTAETTKG